MADGYLLDRVYESTTERVRRKKVHADKLNASLLAADQLPNLLNNSLAELMETDDPIATIIVAKTGYLF